MEFQPENAILVFQNLIGDADTAVPTYRIHRMRDHVRASFRNAPHTSGVAQVKPRDFLPLPEILEAAESIEAASPYAAWHEMLESDHPLIIGDLLESVTDGKLFLCKYVGFDAAQWLVPEAAQPNAAATDAAPAPATATQ
jgi:hypothetical protein